MQDSLAFKPVYRLGLCLLVIPLRWLYTRQGRGNEMPNKEEGCYLGMKLDKLKMMVSAPMLGLE